MEPAMFQKNDKHRQIDIFGLEMNATKRRKLDSSIWQTIREHVFEKVSETSFSVLYSERMGRPNAPINTLITLLTIKELFDWSFRELESQMEWHIGVQYACGMDIGESTLTLRTITNFIQSLREHQEITGIDLFALEFRRLVIEQINLFNVSTKIARTDSTYIDTNVISYNRLQFLIEIVKRVYRILDSQDKVTMTSVCSDYVTYDADNYVYALKSSQIQEEFLKIGHCYYTLPKLFKDKYANAEEWKLFLRVYVEQFKPGDDDDKLELKPSSEMTSSNVRGVDDPEATLRSKSGHHYLGFVGQIVETANPENGLNLLCEVSVYPNNASDEQMLVDSFDELKSNTLPQLDELHFDAGYGGPILDDKLAEYSVNGIQTGIRGVKTTHRMNVILTNGLYYVTCPEGESIVLQKARTGYKAEFSREKCSVCSKRIGCPVSHIIKTDTYIYYLQEKALGKRIRLTNLKTIPQARRTLRSGVEATVRQFKCHTKSGKSRLRGRYRHQLWFQLMALAINLKRIYNYNTGAPKNRRNRTWASIFNRFCALNRILSRLISALMMMSGEISRVYIYNQRPVRNYLRLHS
jgi:hypothetical protein